MGAGRGRLDGKVALVTGASRGIGREIALTLAREGASVGVNDLPEPGQTALADEVVDQARQLGAKAVSLPADVTDARAMREAVTTLLNALGRVDVVVTNAGIVHRQPLVDVTEAEWDRVIAVNLKGTFNAIHAVLPHLVRQRSGKIVTVASELALVGRAGLAAYAASKAGVIGLTKSLARELAPLGINVNAVAPGPTDTDMLRSNPDFRDENKGNVPLRRWGQPRDIALTVLFLASADSDYYAGQILSPNGGVVM
jgi:NAD(P)-dependent dehydrogenase (short-subunit alcohol dehydrogenase family)